MLKKYVFISIIILFAIGLYAQTNAPLSVTEKPVEAQVEFNRIAVITFAKTYLGANYCFGSFDPEKGFDCSGFVYFVFKHFNINVPRSSKEFKLYGTSLNPEEFKIGDVLVFYGYKDSTVIGHVGIICEANGMKSKFIHASSGKIKGVVISELESNQYTKRFYKCIDVIAQ